MKPGTLVFHHLQAFFQRQLTVEDGESVRSICLGSYWEGNTSGDSLLYSTISKLL
jgi:hypothetical protein